MEKTSGEFHKILVPVVGTEADDEAIRLACKLTRKSKSKIYVVYVITVKRTLPIDAEIESEIRKGEEILDRVEVIAEEQDCQSVETDLIQAREAGPAIIDEAVEREADLILIGVKYKTRFGQFYLGSVIPYLLKNAPCRVILHQQYVR